METKFIDGKTISNRIKEEIKLEVDKYVNNGFRQPCLAVIQVGDNAASNVYVKNKINACKKVGIKSIKEKLDSTSTYEEIANIIKKLNTDDTVDGILLQLPLPQEIDSNKLIQMIDPSKDVDGFTFINAGKLFKDDFSGYSPCTPRGILELLRYEDIELIGSNCLVIGRSDLVGKPIASMLIDNDATVTVCHSKTKDLESRIKNADIVIVAVGKPNFINGNQLKYGAIVIDVGINRMDNKIVGDVNTDSCIGIASKITPVPGGVGPMTIASLLKNTLKSYKNKI